MAERTGNRFTPTPAGLAVFLLPLILLYRGPGNTDAVSLSAAVGLPSLVIFSLLFLLAVSRRIVSAAGTADTCSEALPGFSPAGFPVVLTVDPPRPVFLPGIRLSVVWKLRFGPFHTSAAAVLPGVGAGTARLILNRRGAWRARTLLRATDPFGFFRLDCPCGAIRTVIVPPESLVLTGSDVPGRPDARTATAPRLKEDADVRMERRSYVPGDDPRRLDWRHYARSGEMLIRVGEDGLPLLGRLWILVPSPEGRFISSRERIWRLDIALEAAADLARRFEETGGDVRLQLPGESGWKTAGDDREERMACSLPAETTGYPLPAPGERLWIVSYPSPAAVRLAGEAVRRGCTITLGIPSEKRVSRIPFGWKRLFLTGGILPVSPRPRLYRRNLRKLELHPVPGGVDVRRI